MTLKTPLYDGLAAYRKAIKARYTMPGHGGSPRASDVLRELAALTPFDVTETPMTGDLFAGEGIVAQAEAAAGSLYGSMGTVFSAGGATLCVNAALLLAGGQGGKLLLDRRCHRSVLHSMILLDQRPLYLYPKGENAAEARIDPADIDRLLVKNSDTACVIITSPSYYGMIEPVEKIAAVCHKHGVPLVVDNSHGSHLIAYRGGKYHPLKLGADLCIDSVHKTLPCFTGGALLHSMRHTPAQLKAAMRLFGSSSPSYLILTSIELCAAYLAGEATEDILLIKNAIARAAARIEADTPLKVICGGEGDGKTDPMRLTLDTSGSSVTGRELSEKLMHHGICPEMADGRYVVFIVSPLAEESQILGLADLLPALGIRAKEKPIEKTPIYRLKQSLLPREAYFSKKCQIPINECTGNICGEDITPYPPGIPIAIAGEVITPELATALAAVQDTILVIKRETEAAK